MTRFAVDLAELHSLIARLTGLFGFVDDQLAALEQQVGSLHSTWSGEAADAYASAHEDWSRGAREMRDGIEALRSVVHRASESYSGAVSANMRMLERT